MKIDNLCIVFAIEHYNPLGVIRSLGEVGVSPVFIAINNHVRVASKSKYIKKAHLVKDVAEGYEILMKEYGNVAAETGKKPLLFTSDDRTTGYLDERYDELKDKFYFFHAGKAGRISEFMDKNNILQLAKKHGLNVLETVVAKKGEVPEGLIYPIITKSISPNVGGWKSDVHICHNEDELREAYKKIDAHTVLIQRYIEKKNEYCLDGVCGPNGDETFIAIASTYSYLIDGYYSPRQDIVNFKNEKLQKALGGMMKEIGFNGIFSIEFLIGQDDELYFLEFNFRNSTWSYASTVAGMSLPVLWAESMLTGKIAEDAYKEIPEGYCAMVEPIDYAKRVKTGRCSLWEWITDFKSIGCTYYYNEKDMEPWKVVLENIDTLG